LLIVEGATSKPHLVKIGQDRKE